MSESITVNLSETVEAITVNIGEAALAEHVTRTSGVHGISVYGASLVSVGDAEEARSVLDLTPAWVQTVYNETVSLGTGDDIAENSSSTVYRWSSEAISEGIHAIVNNKFQNSPEFPNGFNAGGDTLAVTSGSVTTSGNLQVGGSVDATSLSVSGPITFGQSAYIGAANRGGFYSSADGVYTIRNQANTANGNLTLGTLSAALVNSAGNLEIACAIGGRLFLNRGLNTAWTLNGASLNGSDITASTNSTTGALVTAGGLGVAGNANIGGNFAASGSVTAGSNLFINSGSVIFGSFGRIFSPAGGRYRFSNTALSDGIQLDVTAGLVTVKDFANAGLASLAAANLTLSPSASVTPASNGNLVVEATSNTQLTFKLRGSDGVVRTGTLALA